MPTATTTSLKLDAETKDRLNRLAEARRRSAHWVMREAVRQYLDREEARERMHHDALAAWNEFQATGQHVTAEDADIWLAKLEAGEDAPAPVCRT